MTGHVRAGRALVIGATMSLGGNVGAEVVFAAVVLTRFLLPLLIPRYPLPAILGCLVVDGVDQTIFQAFGYDPPGYQGYDKAMDVFYLAIAYITTMRNWKSIAAFGVARFLFFFRMVGVVAFELAQVRALLLVFPNTFEYFFIAYEACAPAGPAPVWGSRWVIVAGVIWVVVKLPQEYWIHIAQHDLTDALRDHAWAPVVLVAVVLGAVAALRYAVVPRLGPPDPGLRLAADPLPPGMSTGAEAAAWRSAHTTVLSALTAEKVVLVGLISVSFAGTVPGVRASDLQLFIGVGAFVVVNAALVLALSRREITTESLAVSFVFRMVVNLALVVAADWLLNRERGDLDLGNATFFVFLLSVLTTLFDRYAPIQEWRRDQLIRAQQARPEGG